MNFNKMLKNMFWQGFENKKFWNKNRRSLSVQEHQKGDILVMRAHQAARDAMKKVHPELLIGLSLSLHDIQAVDGGDAAAKA